MVLALAKDELLEQLAAAFGKKKAKQLVKEIKKFKDKHPNEAYSFIFNEDGTFTAIKKQKILDQIRREEEEIYG